MKKNTEIKDTTTKKIQSFWSWFTKNQTAIKQAFSETNATAEVFRHLNRKLNNISKKIGFLFEKNKESNTIKLIFTVHGYRKRFPEVNALVATFPNIPGFEVQAFIQPAKDIETFKQGTDYPYIHPDFELKISEMKFNLLDYNTTLKKIKIKVFLQNYKYHYDNPFLSTAVFIVLEELIGEIAFRKHIKDFILAQLPDGPEKLMQLYDLQNCINYLNAINRNSKKHI